MLIASIPREFCSQLARAVPFAAWGACYVGGSGPFRAEQSVHLAAPKIPLHSCDASLYSAALGSLFAGGGLPVTFTARLAFIEAELARRRDRPGGEEAAALDRCAAVMVAQDMSRFTGANDYSAKHFDFYRQTFDAALDKTGTRIRAQAGKTPLASFTAGDYSEHIARAVAAHEAGAGAGLVLLPAFFPGRSGGLYKFLDENTAWAAPPCPAFSPKTLPGILERLGDAGLPYCVACDALIPGHRPVIEFVTGRRPPQYAYTSAGRSSLRRLGNKPVPFRYTPLELGRISAASRVAVIPAEAGQMNFLKDVYLSKTIIHSTGMYNYLVLIDGMLVGGIIYTLPQHGSEGLYLLSDVCASPEMRLSKLLSTIATSRTLIRPIEVRNVRRINTLTTTAFTPRAVSMKYRGVFELVSRRPSERPGEGNVIQYESRIRDETPQEMFRAWHARSQAEEKEPRHGRRGSRKSRERESGPG